MSKIKIVAYSIGCLSFFIATFIINCPYNSRTNKRSLRTEADEANETNWLRDWHNHEEIEAALKMEGLGQIGQQANFEDYRKELYNKYGYDALLSDAISLHRSIPDVRTLACKNMTYLGQLPRSSIIITFHNERLSVLLRTVYSILNRTPAELLEEIILVDDGSTWPDMHEDLEQYMQLHFSQENSKVQLIRLPKRSGLMAARMAGARAAAARSEVLIFLDSHFEVGYNWLPPLLEPIAIDSKTCTCPIIDQITFDTFEYIANTLTRGAFDYRFNYQIMDAPIETNTKPEMNYENYVLMGGAMAIDKKFFWELGGFDEGMTNWGGEQFEMSFKIWMCGGKLIKVPCSRMGHLFRDVYSPANKLLYDQFQFCNQNYKRILDVWIDDENRKHFLEQRPSLKSVDAGDLVARLALAQRLQCKSFSWMIQNIMPHLKKTYLRVELVTLASGLIRSLHTPTLCMALSNDGKVLLEPCPNQSVEIKQNMSWQYTSFNEIRVYNSTCLELNMTSMSIQSYGCHLVQGNQKWYYDRNTQSIMKPEENFCMFANIEEQRIQLKRCDGTDNHFKWTFSHMNQTLMDQWDVTLRS